MTGDPNMAGAAWVLTEADALCHGDVTPEAQQAVDHRRMTYAWWWAGLRQLPAKATYSECVEDAKAWRREHEAEVEAFLAARERGITQDST